MYVQSSQKEDREAISAKGGSTKGYRRIHHNQELSSSSTEQNQYHLSNATKREKKKKKKKKEKRRKKETHLQTLRSSTLQQIIQPTHHHRPISITMNLEPAHTPPLLPLNIRQPGHIPPNRDQFLVLVFLFIELLDVFGVQFVVEGHGEDGGDTAEPGCDGGCECDFEWFRKRGGEGGGEETREMMTGFAFVNVVGESVRTDPAVQRVWCDFRCRGRSTVGFGDPSGGSCTAVPRDSENGRPSTGFDVGEERSDEELG